MQASMLRGQNDELNRFGFRRKARSGYNVSVASSHPPVLSIFALLAIAYNSPSFMALSFRKRLAKGNAQPDLKHVPSERGEAPGAATNSREGIKPKLTQDQKQKQDQQEHIPIASNDLNATPPPPIQRELRSASEASSRNTSPPQSLLDRYKNRTAKGSLSNTTASPVKSAKSKETYKFGKDTAFSEDFEDLSSTHAPEWVDVPDTPEREATKETRVYDGVKFEMIGKKGQAGEAPLASDDIEPFEHRRRSTRSQPRRQQRVDSHDSTAEPPESDRLLPPGLNIQKAGARELPRTPSPQTGVATRGHGAAQMGLTPSNSPRDLPTPPQSSPIGLVDRVKNLTPFSNLPPSPDPITEVTNYDTHYQHKPSDSKPIKFGTSSTPVIPPPADITISNGYQWTSPLPSSSRPSEPWGWLKVWTCCRCGNLDRMPAQTMVEQKVCSRLTCGHERCGLGCKITREPRFELPVPLQG